MPSTLHMLVLGWIADHPGAWPQDVALAFGLEEETAVEILDELATAGYLHRMTSN